MPLLQHFKIILISPQIFCELASTNKAVALMSAPPITIAMLAILFIFNIISENGRQTQAAWASLNGSTGLLVKLGKINKVQYLF